MRSTAPLFLALVLASSLGGLGEYGGEGAPAARANSGPTRPLPLAFVEVGQAASAFQLRQSDRTLFITLDCVMFSLGAARQQGGVAEAHVSTPPTKPTRWNVRVSFPNRSSDTALVGEGRASKVTRFASAHEGQRFSQAFPSLRYAGLWNGIDLLLHGSEGSLKYDFIVQPDANVSTIRLRYEGAENVLVDEGGNLQVHTPLGGFTDQAPIAYQDIDGERIPVDTRYSLARVAPGTWECGFVVGRYDPRLPLIIDPVVIDYCGVFGGYQDEVYAVAVDQQGSAYLAGATESGPSRLPVTVGPDLTYSGPYDVPDAWVGKLSPDGSAFEYFGYIGGLGTDVAYALAVDTAGSAYVVGYTDSRPATFPVKIGPSLVPQGPPARDGGSDGFIAKVAPDGASLEYCGYIGGEGSDPAYGVAVDGAERAYVVGNTTSSSDTFPVLTGPSLELCGRRCGWIARITAEGHFDYCGYVGGEDGNVSGVAVDPSGNAYVLGATYSTSNTFPALVGPSLVHRGISDVWVGKVREDGSGLAYCGYIGGAEADWAGSIAVDHRGRAIIAGSTRSREDTFPVRVGPDLTANSQGDFDGFVARVRPDGSGLEYCGFIGGTGGESVTGVGVDGQGRAYVGGSTESPQPGFPVRAGPDVTFNGRVTPSYTNSDAFVARVNLDGSALEYCGYLGTTSSDTVIDIAASSGGDLYAVGRAGGQSFPVRRSPWFTGSYSVEFWVARIIDAPDPSARKGRLFIPKRVIGFRRVLVGSTRTVKLRVQNRGTGSLWVSIPPLLSPFSLAPVGEVVLSRRQSLELTLSYSPTSTTSYSDRGTLVLTSSDPKNPLLQLELTGIPRAPTEGSQ